MLPVSCEGRAGRSPTSPTGWEWPDPRSQCGFVKWSSSRPPAGERGAGDRTPCSDGRQPRSRPCVTKASPAWACLSRQAFLAAGAALYAGEGAKRDGKVVFANSDPRMVAFFCAWLRRFFDIVETRLTVRVYLHEGLDLDAAQLHWSQVTGVPLSQFRTGYRGRGGSHHPDRQTSLRLRLHHLLLHEDASGHHGLDGCFAIVGGAIRGSSTGRAFGC